jgi:hypothetical protein
MVTASFYRDQATLLFKLAAATSDPIAAEQLLRLAQDYLVAIKLLEEWSSPPAPTEPHTWAGQQQQQMQPRHDDDKE